MNRVSLAYVRWHDQSDARHVAVLALIVLGVMAFVIGSI